MAEIYLKHSLGDSEEERAFYQAIGRNVVLWGRLEACIITTLLRTLHHPKATFAPPDEMPVAWAKRLVLWKRLFKDEPLVAVHKSRALTFASRAGPISKKRHALIHASIGRFLGDTEGASARAYKHSGSTTFVRDFRVLTSDLVALEAEVVALYALLSPIATRALLLSLSPQGFVQSGSPAEPVTTGSQGP